MAKLTELKERDTGEVIYPKTITTNVYTETGTKLNEELNNKADVSSLSNVKAEQVIDNPLLNEIKTLTREEIRKTCFIDMWNTACGKFGTYNKSTGYFELNGITDIRYDEALRIYQCYTGRSISYNVDTMLANRSFKCRTFIPNNDFILSTLKNNLFDDNKHIEIVKLFYSSYVSVYVSGKNIFGRCPTIKKWVDVITWFDVNNNNKYTFYFDSYHWYPDNHPFNYFRFKNTNFNVNCQDYENIGIDSFQFLVENRCPLTSTNANPITVTVHPKVYAKLTGDTTSDAYNNLSDEENSQWTDLFTLAQSKEVQFATI